MGYEVDTIHKEMLAGVPDTYQKTVGFPTYDLTRAFALAVESLGGDLEIARAKTNVDALTGEELSRWCRQRKGVLRKEAVKASGAVTIVAGSGAIQAGDRFETVGGIQFAALEASEVNAGDAVAVEAVEAGSAGNVAAGTVTLMPVTLRGIVSVTNTAPMAGGYDAETDDSLRARYYAAILSPVASANKAAYRQWALEVAGVGDAQVYPLAQGDNTVEVCIIDDAHQPPGPELVAQVQRYLDPEGAGLGEGAAPIGCYCSVTAAQGVAVNVACAVTLAAGYERKDVLERVTAAIRAYLAGLDFAGGSSYVSYAQVANAVHDAEGVLDYAGLTVNGGTANIAIGGRQVAVVGTVSIG